MAKRGYWAQVQREIERERLQRERAYRAMIREQERAARAAERERVREEKERARLYAEARSDEVDAMNERLQVQLDELEGILEATLSVDDYIDFESLKRNPEVPGFDTTNLPGQTPRPLRQEPVTPSGLTKLLPGANAEVEAANREVDLFRTGFEAGDPAAVVDYFGLVLTSSRYPDGFPKTHKLAFVPESKQLVLEYDLPTIDAIPEVRQYKYVKTKDDVVSAPRPQKERRALYSRVVAQTTLRSVHELFEADRGAHVDTIVFNGYVDTIDPRTGRPARPCLVTVRTTRDAFEELDLGRVEPLACLKGLNASVSKDPAELAPVRPVLEFSMVDARFVEEDQILATLDQRPNLMELTPGEFESLITNLFESMGLETRMTQASRDGGVDCVAYDPRPIFGGKVVIQAKRYKYTVGVSAVRDLFGTMQNEGASKGILVTTSGYGKASFEFAEGKPLELLAGTNLLYLLQEHAGIEAKIEAPEDWMDPVSGDVQTA